MQETNAVINKSALLHCCLP